MLLGVVAIGRNEGERLVRCLRSVAGPGRRVVYVDSGSADGSAARAREAGADVVELDAATPFTAARARNAGFARLLGAEPGVEFVQFLDGDCEADAGWWDKAVAVLGGTPDVAVVCGRRRERFPEASVYNKLCDMEWDTPVGQARACGGDATMRVAALRQAGGAPGGSFDGPFNGAVIAGEEPELCVRLRRAGWRVMRIDAEMTRHDAAMTRFGQWWKRSVRAGHAFAEGAALHGRGPERHWVRESRGIWFWGAAVPAAALGAAWPTSGLSLALLGGYGALGWKVARALRRRGVPAKDARAYARFCVLGKFPQVLGQLTYWSRRLRGTRAGIIEYKRSAEC